MRDCITIEELGAVWKGYETADLACSPPPSEIGRDSVAGSARQLRTCLQLPAQPDFERRSKIGRVEEKSALTGLSIQSGRYSLVQCGVENCAEAAMAFGNN